MIAFQDYKHCIPIQIRFSDIDRLDHVNNACYHNFVELGRVNYFKDVLANSINWNEKGFVLARTEIDHLHSLYLHDEVFCFTKVEKTGNKSMIIRNSIVRKEKSGELTEAAAIKGILVAMDYQKNESIIIPEKWVALMQKHEGW